MRGHTWFASAVAGLAAGAGLLAAAAIAAPPAQAAQAAPAAQTVSRTQASTPQGVAALGAELANATSGAVLWSRDPQAKRPMGSVTKVMTAYIVIEEGGLNRAFTVPKGITGYDDKYDASTAGLVPGERYTALQLLYAMLLPSGCDAAYTLADMYGPGTNQFIAKMNTTAKRLGLTRTYFTDFSGLPDPSETSTYSTPRDLLVLGRDAMNLALFRQVVATKNYPLAKDRWHGAHSWTNLNQLLWSYSGAIGIKTGQTQDAGACLLFEARRGSKTLIGVVLHSSDTLSAAFSDATKILNWGFA
jgi:serine-type D-Ala-D-Ala carboxypeptidase (penicillin-binding protein 5/6)